MFQTIEQVVVRDLGGTHFLEGELDGKLLSVPIVGNLGREATNSQYESVIVKGLHGPDQLSWGPRAGTKCVVTPVPLDLASPVFRQMAAVLEARTS